MQLYNVADGGHLGDGNSVLDGPDRQRLGEDVAQHRALHTTNGSPSAVTIRPAAGRADRIAETQAVQGR